MPRGRATSSEQWLHKQATPLLPTISIVPCQCQFPSSEKPQNVRGTVHQRIIRPSHTDSMLVKLKVASESFGGYQSKFTVVIRKDNTTRKNHVKLNEAIIELWIVGLATIAAEDNRNSASHK